MRSWVKHGMVVAIAFAVTASTLAIVADRAESADPVKVRQALMKENFGAFKQVSQFVKGSKRAPNAEAIPLYGQQIAANASRMASLFAKGSSLADMPGKTRAKPEIWQDFQGFKAAAANMKAEAEKLAQVAESGDKEAIGKALKSLNDKGCTGCHQKFRGPRPKKK